MFPIAPALRPELARLVEAGLLARAVELDPIDAVRHAGELVAGAARRGDMTWPQALALASLLGVTPANDRS